MSGKSVWVVRSAEGHVVGPPQVPEGATVTRARVLRWGPHASDHQQVWVAEGPEAWAFSVRHLWWEDPNPPAESVEEGAPSAQFLRGEAKPESKWLPSTAGVLLPAKVDRSALLGWLGEMQAECVARGTEIGTVATLERVAYFLRRLMPWERRPRAPFTPGDCSHEWMNVTYGPGPRTEQCQRCHVKRKAPADLVDRAALREWLVAKVEEAQGMEDQQYPWEYYEEVLGHLEVMP